MTQQPLAIEHRLVIGPGGSGRTHRLRVWVDELEAAVVVSWVSGSSIRAVDESDLIAMVPADAELLVVDDLQWLTDGAIAAVAEFARSKPVWASRRPWPSTEQLRLLDDQLTSRGQAERTVFVAPDDFGAFLAELQGRAAQGELVDRLVNSTGGSVGLTADAVASSWDGDLDRLPEALIDAVVTRVRKAGPEAAALAAVLAVEPGIDPGLAARALPPGIESRSAQRGLRAAGLVDAEGMLLPLVASAVLGDLSIVEQQELHDRLGSSMAAVAPDRAADHLRAGAQSAPDSVDALIAAAERVRRTDPERAIALVADLPAGPDGDERVAQVRAEAAFHLGSATALTGLDQIPIGATPHPRAALLGFGLDVRELRWAGAAARTLPSELGPQLQTLSLTMLGQFDLVATLPEPSGPLTSMLGSIISGLEAIAMGSAAPGLASLAAAADDYQRLSPDIPLGFSPHLIASWAAVALGDLAAAEDFASIGAELEQTGEAVSLELQLAFVRLLDGRYTDALAQVRDGEQDDWSARDRLLLAVLDAGLARRSGDTARLRDAWRRADPVLVRHNTSWLLIDPLTELLAAGAKIGNTARVAPLLDALNAQIESFAPASPAPSNARWLDLQLGLATDDSAAVTTATDELRQCTSPGTRSQARVDAAPLWAMLMTSRLDTAVAGDGSLPTETAIVDAAAALADGGETWEASRLAGAAAIEFDDPGTARRLLERARTFTVDVDEADAEDPLIVLGLSEREADVARLVAEGRTHKETGAQLFISPKTVEHHVARIRQKLGASSRAELLAIVREAVGEG